MHRRTRDKNNLSIKNYEELSRYQVKTDGLILTTLHINYLNKKINCMTMELLVRNTYTRSNSRTILNVERRMSKGIVINSYVLPSSKSRLFVIVQVILSDVVHCTHLIHFEFVLEKRNALAGAKGRGLSCIFHYS